MLAKIQSFGLLGIDGCSVIAEVDIQNGMPSYDTVGLPDAAVKESKERVRAAIKNSGFEFPFTRITVNLAPADIKKEGSIYDLPIAIGILQATGQLPEDATKDTVFIGELSLDGSLRAITGVLPMLIAAGQQGFKKIIIPKENSAEAQYIEGLQVYAVDSLQSLIDFFRGDITIAPCDYIPWKEVSASNAVTTDFAQIKGQQGAKRAAEIAAAGGHNMLMVGPPGSGKTMLARAIPSILPAMTFQEALEVTKIHSITGALDKSKGIIKERPFRSPHHTSSAAALTGGGAKAKPGEVSMAHFGVLFLDELPEYSRNSLEAMRQPLEDGVITVTRVQNTVSYPARFMLVASMNPCPCGNFGAKEKDCKCTPIQISRYLGRISGPLLDRIDLQIEVEPVTYNQIAGKTAQEESSNDIRERVQRARELQLTRFKGTECYFNAQMDSKLINKHCILDKEAEALLKQAFTALKMSARAYTRVLKVARTIADLASQDKILAEHIAEAIQYRNMDRKYWA